MLAWLRQKTAPREPSEATLAREAAERDLTRTLAETPYYRDLGERIQRHAEENHFSALFRAIHDQKG